MIFDYFVYGILITVGSWIIQQQRWKVVTRIPCVIIIIGALSFRFLNRILTSPVFLSSDVWYDKSPWVELLFFIFMILGMSARYFSKAIETRREKIDNFKKINPNSDVHYKPNIEFDFWEFSYPFFFSFITFGLLLKSINSYEINISNTALCFQTGFFWQTIIKSSTKEYS